MKMIYKNISIESKFLNNKNWNFGKISNYNNHKIIVVNLDTKKRFTFDFWNSISGGEIKTENDLICAFECFINDSISSLDTFEDFCDNLGYENNNKGKNIYNTCIKSLNKFERVLSEYDIYEFYNELNDFIDENY